MLHRGERTVAGMGIFISMEFPESLGGFRFHGSSWMSLVFSALHFVSWKTVKKMCRFCFQTGAGEVGPRDKTTDAGESTEWGKTVKHKK